MAANDLTDPQVELALARIAAPAPVAIETVRAQRSRGAAFTLACTASGLDDKEIYLSCGIDAGHFSRIKKGEAEFPADRVAKFCDTVRNTIYPEWIAYQVGCTLVLIKSEAGRRAESEKTRADEAERKLAYLEDLFKRRAVA